MSGMKSQMGDASPAKAGEVRFGEAGEPGSGNRPLGPDFTAGLWTSWVEWAARQATSMGASAANRNWWQVLLDRIASDPLQGGIGQLFEALSKDPTLRVAEDTLNANPLRQIIPLDWAEIVRALRTAWLQVMSSARAGNCEHNRVQPPGVAVRPRHMEQGRSALVRCGAFGRVAGGGRRQTLRSTGMAGQPSLSYAEGAILAGV